MDPEDVIEIFLKIEDHWSAKDVDEKSNVQADSDITSFPLIDLIYFLI